MKLRCLTILLLAVFALLALLPLSCLYAAVTPHRVTVRELGEAEDFALSDPRVVYVNYSLPPPARHEFCPRPDCHCEGTGICTTQHNCYHNKKQGRWWVRADGKAVFCTGKPYVIGSREGQAILVDGCGKYRETFELLTGAWKFTGVER